MARLAIDLTANSKKTVTGDREISTVLRHGNNVIGYIDLYISPNDGRPEIQWQENGKEPEILWRSGWETLTEKRAR